MTPSTGAPYASRIHFSVHANLTTDRSLFLAIVQGTLKIENRDYSIATLANEKLIHFLKLLKIIENGIKKKQ